MLFFWTGTHNDYHKPSDTAEKINYEGEARILSFVERLIRDVDKNDKRPTYTLAKSESQGRSNGFRVYLGTIPNYADSNDGLLIDGVRDASPAAKAGLKAGDKIVRIAGRDVKNVYDYTYALGEMKANIEYEVELVRSAETLKLKITPAARASPEDAAVCTMLFSRMFDSRKRRSTAIEITAAGMDADTVIPANRPR